MNIVPMARGGDAARALRRRLAIRRVLRDLGAGLTVLTGASIDFPASAVRLPGSPAGWA